MRSPVKVVPEEKRPVNARITSYWCMTGELPEELVQKLNDEEYKNLVLSTQYPELESLLRERLPGRFS